MDKYLKKLGLYPTQLTLDAVDLFSWPEVVAAVMAFAGNDPVAGWLAFQSEVVCVTKGMGFGKDNAKSATRLAELFAGPSVLVNGELAYGSTSLQLSWTGQAWRCVRLHEGEGKTDRYWVDEVTHLGDYRRSSPATHFNLKYRRYWSYSAEQGYQPAYARLDRLEVIDASEIR